MLKRFAFEIIFGAVDLIFIAIVTAILWYLTGSFWIAALPIAVGLTVVGIVAALLVYFLFYFDPVKREDPYAGYPTDY